MSNKSDIECRSWGGLNCHLSPPLKCRFIVKLWKVVKQIFKDNTYNAKNVIRQIAPQTRLGVSHPLIEAQHLGDKHGGLGIYRKYFISQNDLTLFLNRYIGIMWKTIAPRQAYRSDAKAFIAFWWIGARFWVSDIITIRFKYSFILHLKKKLLLKQWENNTEYILKIWAKMKLIHCGVL